MEPTLSGDIFEAHLKAFAIYLKCDELPEVEAQKYYNKFKHLSNRRFSKIIKWLYGHYGTGFKREFPLISDFQKAFINTSEGSKGTYKPIPEEPRDPEMKEEVSRLCQKFAKEFETPESFRIKRRRY